MGPIRHLQIKFPAQPSSLDVWPILRKWALSGYLQLSSTSCLNASPSPVALIFLTLPFLPPPCPKSWPKQVSVEQMRCPLLKFSLLVKLGCAGIPVTSIGERGAVMLTFTLFLMESLGNPKVTGPMTFQPSGPPQLSPSMDSPVLGHK